MTGQIALAVLAAIGVWWAATGTILLAIRHADGRERQAISGQGASIGPHAMLVVVGLPVLALGFVGAFASLAETTTAGAYRGFLSALTIWGWIELAFLAGVVTGPSRQPCPVSAKGADRLSRAWATVSHHELALLSGLLALMLMSGEAANTTALWTYAILFGARILAKINLFLGVPRINLEFVPAPLDHLRSYLRPGPITPAFPVAVTLLSLAVGCFAYHAATAAAPADAIGFTLLASLTALALLEHWLMVLPLPDAKLWRWMLPETPTQTAMTAKER